MRIVITDLESNHLILLFVGGYICIGKVDGNIPEQGFVKTDLALVIHHLFYLLLLKRELTSNLVDCERIQLDTFYAYIFPNHISVA